MREWYYKSVKTSWQCDEGHWYVVNKQVPCQVSVIIDESGKAEVKFLFLHTTQAFRRVEVQQYYVLNLHTL